MTDISTIDAPTGAAEPPGALRLAVIVASVREGRFGPTIAGWFAGEAARYGRFAIDVIDLADLPLPVVLPRFGDEPDPATARVLAELTRRLDDADAFVVVTPEYNHGLPASLKNAVDWTGPEWNAKPAGLVSYGGHAGGVRAAEQLRQVLLALDAVTVRESLTFHHPREIFDEQGVPKDAENCAAAAKSLLRTLDWWASTLREGRERRPYAG